MQKSADKPGKAPITAPVTPPKKETRASVRRKAQRAIEIAEEEQRRGMLRKRIELANQGLIAYKKADFLAAVRSFQTYLAILENWKSCPRGALSPSLFDPKKDMAEMLLISGVYWDLVKVYDRSDSPKAKLEFQHFMEKFILFSKGMPYQSLCAESLRKYTVQGKPVHDEAFKNAYKMLGNARCFVATSLLDVMNDVETLPSLRRLRDERLAKHIVGRALTRAYYVAGPGMAWLVDRLPLPARTELARRLESFARRVS